MVVHYWNAVFIHIPKTAGNFLTKKIFVDYSQNKLIVDENQDGVDRFEVKGEITKNKHMSVSDYSKFIDISNYSLITCVRDPVERLISLYFSPNRWIKLSKVERGLDFILKIINYKGSLLHISRSPKKAVFKARKFRKLISQVASQSEKLTGFENFKNIIILNQETIDEDCQQLSNAFNVPIDKKIFKIKINSSSKNISDKQIEIAKKMVMNSKHSYDYVFLNKIKSYANK